MTEEEIYDTGYSKDLIVEKKPMRPAISIIKDITINELRGQMLYEKYARNWPVHVGWWANLAKGVQSLWIERAKVKK